MTAPTTVRFVRHAESDLNVNGRALVGGRSNHTRLSPAGEAAALALGRELGSAGPVPDALYCTSAVRSRRTAELIAQGARWDLTPEVEDAFLELSQGSAEGQPREAWWTASALAAMDADPLGHRLAPDGESHTQVQERMLAGVCRLAEKHPGGRVLVVGHGIAMRSLAWRLLGGPHSVFQQMPMPNLGSLTFFADASGVRLADG